MPITVIGFLVILIAIWYFRLKCQVNRLHPSVVIGFSINTINPTLPPV